MDWFIPVLLLSVAVIILVWIYLDFDYFGGWPGMASYFGILLGIRITLVRRQQLKLQKMYVETAEWIDREVDKVYGNDQDPSGKVFTKYSNLFSNLAALESTKLDELTAKLDALQPHKPFRANRIAEILKELGKDMAFNSNAIEGNPITARETMIILSGYSVGGGRTLRDVFDILGHEHAFEEILRLVADKSHLTMDHLLLLHKRVLLESKDGGILRSGREIAMISGAMVLFAPPWQVKNLVEDFLRWLLRSSEEVHPFLLAVSCHSIFVRIHPFRDGNGRLARLLMNLVLLRAGYPPIIVLKRKETAYKNSIKKWNAGDPVPLTYFMLDMLDRSFALYFHKLNVKF